MGARLVTPGRLVTAYTPVRLYCTHVLCTLYTLYAYCVLGELCPPSSLSASVAWELFIKQHRASACLSLPFEQYFYIPNNKMDAFAELFLNLEEFQPQDDLAAMVELGMVDEEDVVGLDSQDAPATKMCVSACDTPSSSPFPSP